MVKQKMDNPHTGSRGRQRNCRDMQPVRQVSVTTSTATSDSANLLMERVVEQSNMQRAWSRVKSNKGCTGVDGLDIGQTAVCLKDKWPQIKQQLLEGRYKPEPVLRIEIPKPKGGTRKLGIPTVTDRLIQQAMQQVLGSLFDPYFSESRFGFRPGGASRVGGPSRSASRGA